MSAPGGDFEDLAGNIVAKPGGGCHDITGESHKAICHLHIRRL